MKNLLLTVALLLPIFTFSQDNDIDYSLGRSGDYVLGVYLFINSDPVAKYDFVGKVKKFDIFKSTTKDVEAIIKKAKKKNPDFDGMIFKRNFDHVELIKFKSRSTSYAGFELGEKVQYVSFGQVVVGEIVDFLPHKGKVKIRYSDSEGNDKLDTVNIKSLNKVQQ